MTVLTRSDSRRRQGHTRLRTLRLNAGLSPNALGYRAGISGKTVRMAEAGYLPSPRVQYAIAEVFGLAPLELWPLEMQDGIRNCGGRP